MDRLHREFLVRPAVSSKPFPQPCQVLRGDSGRYLSAAAMRSTAGAITSATMRNWWKKIAAIRSNVIAWERKVDISLDDMELVSR